MEHLLNVETERLHIRPYRLEDLDVSFRLIMGMAGASADSETMWQIGIDVIPEYRGRGVATNLTALYH